MTRTRTFLLLGFLLAGLTAGAATAHKAVALLLKCKGSQNMVTEVTLSQKNVFEGRVKRLDELPPGNAYLLNVYSGTGELLFSQATGNPLIQPLESFEPNGTAERGETRRDEGFLNLRLNLPPGTRVLKLRYLRLGDPQEHLISEFTVALDEKN